jgi:hypothetical protein
MNDKQKTAVSQPPPFTPGISMGMVREHAFHLFRDKLPEEPLTLDNWVMAEKDLVASMQAEGTELR